MGSPAWLSRSGLLVFLLPVACSTAPLPAPAPAPTPVATSTAAPVVSAAPRPRPQTSGMPVVLAGRKPTAAPGIEWAWLLPEARLVALQPEDGGGRRAISRPVFYAGPNGALIDIESEGRFVLAADGGTHDLGPWQNVGFDPAGKSVLVSDSRQWALFSRAGERLAGESLGVADAHLLPSGLVLERRAHATRLLRPPRTLLMNVSERCNEVFAGAGRLVCQVAFAGRSASLSVFSLDTGQRVAKIADGPLPRGRAAIAMRGDGGAMAIVRKEVSLVELGRSGAPWPRVLARDLPYSPDQPPRLAFTADGAHLCVQSRERTRIVKTAASGGVLVPPKGRDVLCLFSERPPVVPHAGSRLTLVEWQARLLEVPLHAGFEPISRPVWPGFTADPVVTSEDGKTVAYLEERRATSPDGFSWALQAVVIDTATAAERTIVVGEKAMARNAGVDPPSIELSADGRLVRVCAVSLLGEPPCRTYESATGAVASATRPWLPRAAKVGSAMQVWSGPALVARVEDVAAVLPPSAVNGPTLAKWRDDGAYLSVEIDVGNGVAQHCNLPDSAARKVEDVDLIGKGQMLAVASGGSVALWSVQPLSLLAVLVPAEGGIAALFPDGTVEIIGDIGPAVHCQQEQEIVPVGQCGELVAPPGTLGRIVKEASRQ